MSKDARMQGNGQPTNPLFHFDILVEIAYHLPFEDLKTARLINRWWWRATSQAWADRSQLKFPDIHRIRDFLSVMNSSRPVLPQLVKNFRFEGESVSKLMNDEGITEQDLLKPYWPKVESLTYCNWMKTRFRIEYLQPDPARPYHRERRRIPYSVPSRIGSALSAMQMLKVCTNLKRLTIHYQLLIRMKGAYITPGQFPQLEKLTRLKLYSDGKKWNGRLGHQFQSPAELLRVNLNQSDADEQLPRDVSGGNTFMLRLLEHSPNLTRMEVTSGTVMTAKVETWFLRHLLHWRVKLPKLTDLFSSIRLHEYICEAFQTKNLPLRSLHLKTLPGEDNAVSANALHGMIAKFSRTLQHLELFLMGTGNAGMTFTSGGKLPMLESLEIWGFKGSFAFLLEMPKLRKAVIGGMDQVETVRIQSYFESNPLPDHINLELKSDEDFIIRLDQGPLSPFINQL